MHRYSRNPQNLPILVSLDPSQPGESTYQDIHLEVSMGLETGWTLLKRELEHLKPSAPTGCGPPAGLVVGEQHALIIVDLWSCLATGETS